MVDALKLLTQVSVNMLTAVCLVLCLYHKKNISMRMKKELSDVETAIAAAEANDNQRLLEYNMQLKEQFESIIKKCKGEP